MDILQKVPKTQSIVGEKQSPKRPLSPLDPVFKHPTSIVALSPLGSTINLLSTSIAQDLLCPLCKHLSPTIAQAFLGHALNFHTSKIAQSTLSLVGEHHSPKSVLIPLVLLVINPLQT